MTRSSERVGLTGPDQRQPVILNRTLSSVSLGKYAELRAYLRRDEVLRAASEVAVLLTRSRACK